MTATTDTFARFLDIVGETLDEPDLRPEELAARAFVSRFHFDRLVAAASGEAPGAFRRRVLLERAAHRLVTSQSTVLDVAVEAGYASHEAFTRAFRRAHGTTPTGMRASPAPTPRIAAPSGIHFHPPGGLLLPGTRKVTAMNVLSSMVHHHVHLVDQILERCEALDDATLDAPIEISVEGIDDDLSLRHLLRRLTGQPEMWLAAVEGRGTPEGGPVPQAAANYVDHDRGDVAVTDLRRRFADTGRRFTTLVDDVIDAGTLDDTFVDALCEPAQTFTYAGMAAHVLAFGAHRRTLALGALADAGVTDLGAGDPMAWVMEHA